jgi:hypothetical protein
MSGEMPDIYMGGEWLDVLQTDPAVPHNELRNGSPDLSSLSYAFDSGPFSLSLPTEKQTSLMESIEAIFESESAGDQEMLDADEEEPQVDLEDQKERVEKLRGVLPTIAQLWWCRSEYMELAVQKLADGSRNRKFEPFFTWCRWTSTEALV